MIVGGFAQNWRNAQVRLDARNERMARYMESQTPKTGADSVETSPAGGEQPQAATSSTIIYLATAVAAVGALIAVGELFALLANLELSLPRRVRDGVAMGLVGVLILVLAGLCVMSVLTRAR